MIRMNKEILRHKSLNKILRAKKMLLDFNEPMTFDSLYNIENYI